MYKDNNAAIHTWRLKGLINMKMKLNFFNGLSNHHIRILLWKSASGNVFLHQNYIVTRPLFCKRLAQNPSGYGAGLLALIPKMH